MTCVGVLDERNQGAKHTNPAWPHSSSGALCAEVQVFLQPTMAMVLFLKRATTSGGIGTLPWSVQKTWP